MKHFILALFCVTILPIRAQNLNDSLKAHFRFEGDLTDETGNGNDLVLDYGMELYALASSPADQALLFTGTDRMVSATPFNNSSYNELSVSLWIKTSNPNQAEQVLIQGAFLGFSLQMTASGNILAFCDGSSANGYISTITLDDDQWHSLVMTSDGGTTSLFIDGVLDGTNSEPLYVGSGGSNEIILLGQTTFGVKPYSGLLNDLRIYSRALTQADVTLLHNLSLSHFEDPFQSSLELYPNPYRGGEIRLEGEGIGEFNSVEIFATDGLKAGEMESLGGGIYKTSKRLSPGVYVVRFQADVYSVERRLIVQNH